MFNRSSDSYTSVTLPNIDIENQDIYRTNRSGLGFYVLLSNFDDYYLGEKGKNKADLLYRDYRKYYNVRFQ